MGGFNTSTSSVLPFGSFPFEFGRWLVTGNNTQGGPLSGVITQLNRNGFTVSEMSAMYDVLSNPFKLGTSGNTTLTSICTANPTRKGCGFLFYGKVWKASPPLSPVVNNIQELFCPSPPDKCLNISMAQPQLIEAILLYSSNHLVKLAVETIIDKKN